MSGRPDLLALTDDSLAALANRGLVKRAVREVESGGGPDLVEDADGTVTATWPDGTVVDAPQGAPLQAARCTCAASGVCRHRLMLAVAYRSRGTPVAAGPSPAAFTDEQLEQHVGARAFAAARRALRAGFTARVRRPSADDPVATVELASVTVRFLVAGELGYAHPDAAAGARPDAVVLAVWAWRAADAVDPQAPVVDVSVGGTAAGDGSHGAALELALDALGDLLACGINAAAADVDRSSAVARRALDARNLRWPVDVLDDLHAAVGDYRGRTSAYSPVHAARLVAELVGRARCAAGGGWAPAASVLGTEEAARTPLRLVRLTALGARLHGPDERRALEVYLAHPESATVLVVRRVFEPDDDGRAADVERVGRSTLAGHRLTAVAAAEVVTQSAVRAADRSVTLAASRVARTTVAPSAGRWDALPPGLLLRDLDAAAAELAARPPSVVRPRVAAHDLRAVVVAEVGHVAWHAGAQELVARVAAPRGELVLRARHTAAAPGAVDVLQAALTGELGTLRHVAGHLRRESGGLVLEPTALAVGDRVVVPDLSPAPPGAALPGARQSDSDPVAAALAEALAASAALVHTGWRHLPASWAGRAARAAQGLRRVGLTAAAGALEALPGALGSPEPRRVLDAWADVHLRLLVTAEQL